MHANFTDRARVAALGDADSYATRLFDYEHSGRDQVAWVVELVTYAYSIDFGAKGYGNLAELAALQQHVAGQFGRPAGRLLMIVKSAHVYETERGYVQGVLAEEG